MAALLQIKQTETQRRTAMAGWAIANKLNVFCIIDMYQLTVIETPTQLAICHMFKSDRFSFFKFHHRP